jgi:hypothetical protein
MNMVMKACGTTALLERLMVRGTSNLDMANPPDFGTKVAQKVFFGWPSFFILNL